MPHALLDVLVPLRCVACRSAAGGARGEPLCGARACPARRQAFASSWAAVAYAGPVPALVVALKERGALPVAALMAAQLAAAAPPGTWRGTLVPVPPDPWRRRRRGVD